MRLPAVERARLRAALDEKAKGVDHDGDDEACNFRAARARVSVWRRAAREETAETLRARGVRSATATAVDGREVGGGTFGVIGVGSDFSPVRGDAQPHGGVRLCCLGEVSDLRVRLAYGKPWRSRTKGGDP